MSCNGHGAPHAAAPRLIALVRHPAIELPPGRCYGRLDVPLSAAGRNAIAAIASGCASLRPARVFSSPSRRCTEVAQALAAPRLMPVIEPCLQELDFGAWEGMAWDDVPRAALDDWARDPQAFAPPGGESGAALVLRVRAFHRALAVLPGDTIVVSHGGPLRVLVALLAARPPDLLAPSPTLASVRIVTMPAA